ncbi:MAG TPA: rhodanese-like domain-containing protein [Steroidobacteraceae bacterium]|nr:rhodanese-like domain-containing protein [Steroidobacteraceae bacterium]
MSVLFEKIAAGGCLSYLIGCRDKCVAALIDPEISHLDRYHGLLAQHCLRLRYVIDTHTHADHFSASRQLREAFGAQVAMHPLSPAPYADLRVDDGNILILGELRMQAMHTPGHTRDSMCWQVENHLFTGDTLLFGGTGRTDLPTGDANALYDSLFNRILKLDPNLNVHPAHDYKGNGASTIGKELASNPRLQKRNRDEFVTMMHSLNIAAPQHLTEALRTNMSGGKTIQQLLSEAAAKTPFMSLDELHTRLNADEPNLLVLDVREKEAFDHAHLARARHVPRGQLELRINSELPDPTQRIVVVCDFGKISTLAAATLRELGYAHVVALDGGIKAWSDRGLPLEPSKALL